jgi:hypothetical protein
VIECIFGWCDIVLSVRATTGDKCDDAKGTFYEELECIFDHFPKYHMKFCYETSVQRWGGKIFSIRKLEMKSLHETSNSNGVRLINFAT